MRRSMRVLIVTAVAAALLAVPATAQAATKLTAVVGPAFNISLKMGTKTVTTLKTGTYTITVRDRSNIHNFHLKGSGVNKDSGVKPVGTKTWTVTLRKGTYVYVCDPHKTTMKGSFRVT